MKTDIHFGGDAEMKPEKVKEEEMEMTTKQFTDNVLARIKEMKLNKEVDKEDHIALQYEILLNSVNELLQDTILETDNEEDLDILYDLTEEYELTSEYRQKLHFDYLYRRDIEL